MSESGRKLGRIDELTGGRLDELIEVLESGFREVVRPAKKVEEELRRAEKAVE